jgi:signal transduction histidine kinase
MSQGDDRGKPSPADLLRINRELDAELVELVRTQQRLFVSELDNARQLARLESLTAFAIAAAELADPAPILERAASMIFELFHFEQCVGFVAAPEGHLVPVLVCAVEGLTANTGRLDEWRSRELPWRCPTEPAVERSAVLATHPGLAPTFACVDALCGEAGMHAVTFVLPVARDVTKPLGLMVFRRITSEFSVHEKFPTSSGLAFLSLVSRHLAVTLTNAQLVRGLEASYVELAGAQRALVSRERLAALGELAAQVAHEVRNPLGAIFNALSLLRPLLANVPEGTDIRTILEEEAARINAIVSQLLEFARPTSPSLRPEQIVPVVDDAIEALHGALPGRHVRVEAERDLPPARLDVRMMRQALLNLLTNAAQSGDADSPIHVRVSRDRDTLRIDVVDFGPGIAPEALARIFEPFFTTKAMGTGLGLSVVKRVVEEHGGEVHVTSREGSTVFTIALPLD